MKPKCINGQAHRWWCYIDNGIDYQKCTKAGCQAIRAYKILDERNRLMKIGMGTPDTDKKACGLDKWLKERTRHCKERNVEIRELYERGVSVDELAFSYSCSTRTIARALNGEI